MTDGSADLSVVDVSTPGLAGVFARPKAAGQALPSILLLHGSESGTQASARASATRFARLGYAAFAVIYFAWPGTGVTGIRKLSSTCRSKLSQMRVHGSCGNRE